jgi:hypothetical protein
LIASVRKQQLHAHVQLESADPGGRIFLANHEIEMQDGIVQPIEYEGRTFRFSHRTRIGDYSGESAESFVFVQAEVT